MVESIFAVVFAVIVWDHFRRKEAERLRVVRFLLVEMMERGFSLREIAYISNIPDDKVHAWYDGRRAPMIDDVNAMHSTVLKVRESFISVHQQVAAQRRGVIR